MNRKAIETGEGVKRLYKQGDEKQAGEKNAASEGRSKSKREDEGEQDNKARKLENRGSRATTETGDRAGRGKRKKGDEARRIMREARGTT